MRTWPLARRYLRREHRARLPRSITAECLPDIVDLLIQLPATPFLNDGQTVTLTVSHSAVSDIAGGSFDELKDIPPLVKTGAGGVGGPAAERRVKIPIECRRFVRLEIAVSPGANDPAATEALLAFVF